MTSLPSLSRRSFLAVTAAAPLAFSFQRANRIPIGLELYSVRDELAKDLMGTVRAVAKMGYEVVEFFSPYYQWTPEYAKEVRPSVEYALAKMNNQEVEDSLLFRDLDDDLLKRAKAGERGVLDQMIDNNKDALDVNIPGLNGLPSIPGVTPPGGGSLNDMLKNQLKGVSPSGVPQSDTTRSMMPDSTRRRP